MKKWCYITLAALIAFVIIGASFSGSLAFAKSKLFPTQVTTQYGDLEGFYNTEGAVVWKGIPFAKPPEGELRWKAPQDPEAWDGVRYATEDCTPCTQLITGRIGSGPILRKAVRIAST